MLKASGKKLSMIAIIMLTLLTAIAVFAAALFPNAKISFRGFTVRNGANGKVQGFVEVSLRNVQALGTEFAIEYDPAYLVPSDALTNEPLDDGDGVVKSFAQNTDDFPITTRDTGEIINCFDSENFGTFSKGSNVFRMSIMPNYAKTDGDLSDDEYGPNIKKGDRRNEGRYIDANTGAGLTLGSVSFQIVDPAGISVLSKAELNNVIRIKESDADTNEAYIMYYDPDTEIEDFYAAKEYVEYDWTIETKIISAVAANENLTVSAAQIYNNGITDLEDYLNANARYVILTYSNGAKVRDKITWGDTDKGYSVDKAYDPKGGVYRVTQRYSDDLTVTVTVTVTPVELLAYSVDNKYIAYPNGSAPAAWEDLLMPESGRLVLSEKVDKFILPNVSIDREAWTPSDIPTAMASATDMEFIFTALPDTAALEAELPWLTVNGDITVQVKRYIGDVTSDPEPVTASTDIDGVMTVEIGGLGGEAVPDNTAFRIELPNGLIISTDDDFVTARYNADGTATLTIDTSGKSGTIPELTQKMINLGGDGFSIAAQEPGKGESGFVPFSSNRRTNYYTESKTLDYTGMRRSLFTLEKGTALSDISNHIHFITGDTLSIAYDGRTGTEGAQLTEAIVVEWRIEGSAELALPDSPGVEVTLTGVLADAVYTNHGLVENPYDNVLKLKIVTSDKEYIPDSEKIRIITNGVVEVDEDNAFIFDKISKAAPSPPQQQTFTIENIGDAEIDGIVVSIANKDNDDTNIYFMLESMPDISVGKGETTDFIIRPLMDLKPGTYISTVTVSSKHGYLKSFDISVTVTDKRLYTVKAKENDPTLGRVILKNGTRYESGETVQADIVLFDDEYIFVEWITDPADLAIADQGGNVHTFDMPESDVELTAVLMETLTSKLRLDDLQVRSSDDSLNQLRDSALNVIAFNAKTEEYTVVVPYETDKVKIYFKPRNIMIDDNPVEVHLTYTDGSAIAHTLNTPDGYYHSDLFGLVTMPDENIITISQSYGGETKSYTINIMRRPQVIVTMFTGNSPYGLIEADTRWDATEKAAAKQAFDTNHSYGVDYVPEGAPNTARTKYYEDAWKNTENCDKNPSALFIYEDCVFTDPGFTGLYKMDNVTAVSPEEVTRTLILDELTGTDDTELSGYLNTVSELILTTSGTPGAAWEITELRDRKIRPGIYRIEYTFTDSDGWLSVFSRPVIILSKKGDLNIDNKADFDDMRNIYTRVSSGLSQAVLHGGANWNNIYAYRICDINEDRNVNGADANFMNNSLTAGSALNEYYELLSTE